MSSENSWNSDEESSSGTYVSQELPSSMLCNLSPVCRGFTRARMCDCYKLDASCNEHKKEIYNWYAFVPSKEEPFLYWCGRPVSEISIMEKLESFGKLDLRFDYPYPMYIYHYLDEKYGKEYVVDTQFKYGEFYVSISKK